MWGLCFSNMTLIGSLAGFCLNSTVGVGTMENDKSRDQELNEFVELWHEYGGKKRLTELLRVN